MPRPPFDTWSSTPRTIVIAGASGMIGSALADAFARAGHTVRRLVRRAARDPSEIEWHPDRAELDRARFDDVDVVVNLAGENIGQRWTSAIKRDIRESRVASTTLLASTLASTLAAQPSRPRTLVNASAVGIYGDRGDEVLDESSTPGDGYLASVCVAWEQATAPAARAGVRVVLARLGVVLSPEGGALAKMLTPFRAGVGGRVGSGEQWMSWIALADAVAALMQLALDDRTTGPVNVVSTGPVRNSEFMQTLARVLHRPALLPVPAVALRLAFGEMADATLLASQRVRPTRLLESGFELEFPTLEAALRAELGA